MNQGNSSKAPSKPCDKEVQRRLNQCEDWPALAKIGDRVSEFFTKFYSVADHAGTIEEIGYSKLLDKLAALVDGPFKKVFDQRREAAWATAM